MDNAITLKKNNRIKACHDENGTEYARFHVVCAGVTIGQVQWGGPRQGWGYTEDRTAPRHWTIGTGSPWSQDEAIARLQDAPRKMAEWIRDKVSFI